MLWRSSKLQASCVFFFSATATAEIYTLSLHDALPILGALCSAVTAYLAVRFLMRFKKRTARYRSEEHTSELQSRENLVCRLLLEKKKIRTNCEVVAN